MSNQSAVPSHDGDDSPEEAQVPSLPVSGPRKLVRPSLPPGLLKRRSFARREPPLFTHQHPPQTSVAGHASTSHAEAFYLQKQMQAQTHIVFMLEDGSRLEGTIEWYDAHAIKIRHGHVRTLIYKSAIKYLYKDGDGQV